MSVHPKIDAWLAEQARERAAAVETACEQALQGGEHGVLVVHDWATGETRAAVDPSVPYGHIYERWIR